MKLSSVIILSFCLAATTVARAAKRKPQRLRHSSALADDSERMDEFGGKEERLRSVAAGIKALDRQASGKRRVFIKYKDELSGDERFNMWGQTIKEYSEDHTVVVDVDEETYESLKADDRIDHVDDDNIVQGLSWGNVDDHGAFYRRQLGEQVPWGLKMIQAHKVPPGEEPVKVCIIDTGYAIEHPDLPVEGVTGDNLTQVVTRKTLRWDEDLHGHGSHVAGTIAAMTNNDFGVAGAGPVHLHIARGLDDNNSGYESDIVDALYKCKDAGAKVISLSLGGSSKLSWKSYSAYQEIVHNHGIMVIAAAGNSGKREKLYPASHPDVVSVVAVKTSGRYWRWSNYNDQVELAAPGVSILSTTTSRVAIHSDHFSYPAEHVTGSAEEDVVGTLKNCSYGASVCTGIVDKTDVNSIICLISQGWTSGTINSVVNNCIHGGGRGAVLYGFDSRDSLDNLRSISIPVVHVSKQVGKNLQNHARNSDMVTIAFGGDTDVEYTFDFFTGTSMAAPHVAAAAALVWANFPKCSNHQIRYALARTAEDQGRTGCDDDYGFGVVKAYDAYQFLLKNDCRKKGFRMRPRVGGCSTYEPPGEE